MTMSDAPLLKKRKADALLENVAIVDLPPVTPVSRLLIKRLSDKARLPTRGSPLAAGYDLYRYIVLPLSSPPCSPQTRQRREENYSSARKGPRRYPALHRCARGYLWTRRATQWTRYATHFTLGALVDASNSFKIHD